MRLESLRIKGFGPFREELAIDFARDYGDAKLIAITGENGAGKTCLLELGMPGAMFRDTPTRGTLSELATCRDALLEVRLVNGKPWTLRHLVDGVSKKAEAIVLDGDGQPVFDSGKVSHFSQWAAKHLPAPEVLFTSVFGAQGAEGFIGMKPGERKAVLLRTLGVERYEGMAERARDRAKRLKGNIETLEARLCDESARQGGDPSALGRAMDRRTLCEEELSAARAALVEQEEEAGRVAELARDARAAAEQRTQVEASIQAARESIADLEKRLGNCRAEVADAEAIRAAAAELAALDLELGALTEQRATAATALATAEGELAAARERLASVRKEQRAAQERVARLTERLADQAKVERAAAALPGRHAAVESVRLEVTRLEQALQAIQERRVTGADGRIEALRHGLTIVAKESRSLEEMAIVADTHLDVDDGAVRLAAQAPGELVAATKALGAARAALGAAERELADLERIAARITELATCQAELSEAQATLQTAGMLEEEADERVTAAHKACEPLRDSIQRMLSKAYQLGASREALAALAARVERLARAETMLVEREAQLTAARAELARLEAQHSATPAPPIPPAAPDVAAYRRAVESAERALREAGAAVAVAEARQLEQEASAGRLAHLAAERAGLDDELADWTRLAADLGRDGLQAQLIDAAIPELNQVSNELLHEAFGPRFTVDVRTQALDSKGRRMLETLDVVVIDTEGGREALAETFSGGERVIIQEALSLALTVLACRQNGVERPTLVRDECGAALSAGKAPQWIAMLRRAVDLIGAQQCLFVSHAPATWELADARIHLGAAGEA